MLRVLFLCILAIGPLHAETRPPNIVLIFVDDMGYADISPFGGKVATPSFERMAREGRKFTNFHVSSAVCSASRAALLAGCYHNRVGIHGALGPGAKIGLNPQETTIAELAKSRGYATDMAGKWHLGDAPGLLPIHQGFDGWLGLPYSNDMWPHHPEAKAGTYPKLPLFDGDRVVDDEISPDDQRLLTTRYTERAVTFIERNKARPFFCYLAHNMPHVPLYVSDKFSGKSGAGIYGDVMQEIDWSVGEVLAALDRNGIAENTWVIFTSDNGPWLSYGEHAGSGGAFREGKGTSWEGGTRVPCLMRWPGRIPAGTTGETMLSTIDILPTIAAQIGAKLPGQKIDGLNVWPLIAGESGAKNPHEGYATYYANNELQSVTDGRWKLVFPHTYRTMGQTSKATGGVPAKYRQEKVTQPQLFDLDVDPGEKSDVAAGNSEVLSRLSKFADGIRTDLGDSLTQAKGTGSRAPGRR
jgi:arylsulfatase A